MKKHVWLLLCLLITSSPLWAAPNLNGIVWLPLKPSTQVKPADGKPVPLLPEARQVYERHQAQRQQGDLSFDFTERCQPPGLPRLFAQNQPFEFLQRDERIFIAYQWNRLIRVIDMNVPQPEALYPMFLGQSVGIWQNNTLVIDSTSFNDTTLLDDAGLPHSDALHLTERYQLSKNGKRLTLRVTIEDPQTFAHPWDAVFHFKAEPGGRLGEDVCVERKKLEFWRAKQS
jgi:hypothetical protein